MIHRLTTWFGALVMGDHREKIYLTEEQILQTKQAFGDTPPEVIKIHRQRIYYVASDLKKLDADTRRRLEHCLGISSQPESIPASVHSEAAGRVIPEHRAEDAYSAPPSDTRQQPQTPEGALKAGVAPISQGLPSHPATTSGPSQPVEGEAVSASAPNASPPTEVLVPELEPAPVEPAPVEPAPVQHPPVGPSAGGMLSAAPELTETAQTPRAPQPLDAADKAVPKAPPIEPSAETMRNKTPGPLIAQPAHEIHHAAGGAQPPIQSAPSNGSSYNVRGRDARYSSPDIDTRQARRAEREPKDAPSTHGGPASHPSGRAQKPVARWSGVHATIVGASHLKQAHPTPCQDAAITQSEGRVMLCVADGAGSSILSHLGSDAVVQALRQLVTSLDPLLRALLDDEEEPSAGQVTLHAQVLMRHAVGTLQTLSRTYRHPLEAFRCTLLFAVVGSCRLLWLKVGDGGLVLEQNGSLIPLGVGGKGEYANQTTFLSEHLALSEDCYGIVPMQNVEGLAAFTDGAGEKLISHNGAQVASQVKKFLSGMREGSFGTHKLFEFLAEPSVWKGTTGDDRGMALLARLTP